MRRASLTTAAVLLLTASLPAAGQRIEGQRAFDLNAPAADLAVSADGRRAWVPVAGEPRLLAVPLDRPAAATSVSLPFAGAAVAELGGQVFVGAARSGAVAVLDAATLKPAGQIELRAAAVRRVMTAPAGRPTRVVVLGQSEPGSGAAAVAFVIDPVKPAAVRGIRLADGLREFDGSLSADGRHLYLWRTDSSPTGVQVFDLDERVRVFADSTLSGPVAPDPVGVYAVCRGGEVYTADFRSRVGRTGEGLSCWHPTRPLLATTASEAGFFSGSAGALAASAEAVGFRVTGAGSLRPLLDLTGLPAMPVSAPAFAHGAGALVWLTSKPASAAPGGPVVLRSAEPPPAVLVVMPFDADKVPEPDTLAAAARPPGEAVVGRPYRAAAVVKAFAGRATFLKSAGPAGLTVAPDGQLTFEPTSADAGDHDVAVRATDASGRSIRIAWTLRVRLPGFALPGDDAGPAVVRMSTDSAELYCLDPAARTVEARDPADGRPLRSGPAGAGPVDLAVAGNRLLVLDAGESAIHVLNAADLKTVKTLPLPRIGVSALTVPSAAAGWAFVIGGRDRDQTLLSVDLATGATATVGRPGVPDGRPAASPDGREVYVFSAASRSGPMAELFSVSESGPVEPETPRLGRVNAAALAVGPVDGRVYLGDSAWTPEMTARLGNLPGALSAPHPLRAVVVSVPAEPRRPGFVPATPAAPSADPYLSVADAAEPRERTVLTVSDASGFAPLARIEIPLPAAADELLVDGRRHAALVRCGREVVVVPLPAAVVEPRRYFELLGRPPARATTGAAWKFRPRLVEPPAGGAAVFTLRSAPAGMTADAKTGDLAWTPTSAQVGRHRVLLEAKAAGRTALMAFTVTAEPPRMALPTADYTGAALSGDAATLVLWRAGGDRLTLLSTVGGRPAAVEVGAGIERVFVVDALALVACAGSDALRVIDLGRRVVVDSLVLRSPPVQVLRRPGTAEVYLADEAGFIRRINTKTFVDEGVVARGRVFAFDPAGRRLHSLAPLAGLGFEVPEPEGRAGGGVVMITGGRDEEAALRKPSATPLKIYSVGEAARRGGPGSHAWLTWVFAPEAMPKPETVRGIGALKPGADRPGGPTAAPDGAVFGGPGSPWRLLDAVVAADTPESLAVTGDGAALAYLADGAVRVVAAGDPGTVLATVPLRPRGADAAFAAPDAPVALWPQAVGGAVLVLGRSGRVYALRAGAASSLRLEVVSTASESAPAAAAAERPRMIVLSSSGSETGAPAIPGLALAAADGDKPVAAVCRGREALRFEVAPDPGAAVAPSVEGLPPGGFTPGELLRHVPKYLGDAPILRRVQSGPDGLVMNPAGGGLVWDPPASAPDAVRVVLHLKDKSGRAAFHSFVLFKTLPAKAE